MAENDKTKLKKYLVEHKLLDGYAKFLSKTSSHLIEFLDRDSKLQNKDIAAFYAFSGVLPSAVGIDREMDFFSPDGFEKYDFLSFSDWVQGGKKEKDFIHNYFQTILKKVKEAKERIFIFDLLVDNNGAFPGAPKKEFFEGYESYFEGIENQLSSHRIGYTRILGFPINNKDLEEELGFDDTENGKIKIIKMAIALMFIKTFEHLCNQFSKGQVNLYVLPVAPRNYSILMIDHKYVMTEYFRIRKTTGKPVPDILFINQVDPVTNNPGERLMSVYDKEFQILIDDEIAVKVEAELFCQCTEDLLQKVQENIAFEERKNKKAEVLAKIEKLKNWEERLSVMVEKLPKR